MCGAIGVEEGAGADDMVRKGRIFLGAKVRTNGVVGAMRQSRIEGSA